MPEYLSKDRTNGIVSFGSIFIASGGSDHDRLRVDHFSHYTTGGIRRGDEHRIEVQLLRRNLLQ